MQKVRAHGNQDQRSSQRDRLATGGLRLSLALLGGYLLSGAALADGSIQPVNFVVPDASPATVGETILPLEAPLGPDQTQLAQTQSGTDAPSQDDDGKDSNMDGTDGLTKPADSMPSSLTSPVLDNVPTTLDKSQMNDPMAKEPDASDQSAKPSEKAPQASQPTSAQSDGEASVEQQDNGKREGPRVQQRFSVLFTEQRPFLLYAQDASISYLMPNALVEHPWISRILRGTLENRALEQWQALRAQKQESQAESSGTNRPTLVISGRVEDRFSSSELSSLFLKESSTGPDGSKRVALFSFNFDHRSQQAFGLRDLFRSQNDDALKATISLIDAYLRADIVRQKSVRLGTPISIDQDSWLKGLNPDLALFNTFTLVPSKLSGKIAGLTFHFNPGLLGAEADGPYAVYIPAAIFAASLDPSFAGLFEGEAMLVSRHTATGFSTASVNLDGLRENAELGGDMLIEGEVPGSWCDGFHLTLVDNKTGQIVTEALIELLPALPPYGLAGNMMRFRAELPVSGSGGQQGQLTFEPYAVETSGDRVLLRAKSACEGDSVMTVPDPARDSIRIPVTY